MEHPSNERGALRDEAATPEEYLQAQALEGPHNRTESKCSRIASVSQGKRNGLIKGRTVAEDNKQCNFISKEDASSPTVAKVSVLLTCIVYAEEEWDVAVINIPNAFIQTQVQDEKDMVIIKI
jgi:hypothetical protein